MTGRRTMSERAHSRGRHCLAAMLCAGLIHVPQSAFAFELFGIHLWGKKQEAVEEVEPVPDPVTYKVELSVDNEEIKSDLESSSLLLAEETKPPSGTIGLLTRAHNDQRRLVATLYSLGYYGGTASILVNGRPYEIVPIDAGLDRAGTVNVVIHVKTGPLFHFAPADVVASDGETVDLSEYGVVPGEVAKSGRVAQAASRVVSAWRDKGYAFAKISDQELVANHNNDLLEVKLRLDTGIKAVFGDVKVVGAVDIEPDFIIQQANIKRGAIFSPKDLADASKRLRALGVFSSVVVEEASAPDPDGSVPITITVSERDPKGFGIGLTAATQDGLGGEAFWVNRNLFGRAESLRFEASMQGVGRDNLETDLDYRAAMIFSKPGVFGPLTTFSTKLEAELLDNDAYLKKSVSANFALEREFTDTVSGKAALDIEYADFTETVYPSRSLIVSTPLELTWDTRDDKLNPTKGMRFVLYGEPAFDFEDSASFFKTKAVFSAYQALNEARTFVLAGRLAAGTIVGAGISEVPPDRLFFAGGGGSIRGYAYQAASPRDSDNELIGGLSLIEASVEARVGLTENFGLAFFVDTGGAFSSSTPGDGGQWYTGVGAGVRYNTPVGPLRMDFAIPLEQIRDEPSYGIYLGLGQAF